MNINFKIIFILTLLLSLNSCGFQLRGAKGFDFSYIYIKSESADAVAIKVAEQLKERGISILKTPDGAQAIVYLRNQGVDERMITISSTTGKIAEFELNFHVDMEVRRPDDTVLLEKRRLSILRDYRFDETAVLAAGVESEMLRQEMSREIVAQVIRRLEVLKLGKIQLAKIKFKGLKPNYSIGDTLKLDLIEKTVRSYPVDIWLTLSKGTDIFFLTPSKDQTWQINKQPKAWQTSVPITKRRHHLLNFTIPANIEGKYIFRAAYTHTGTTLDLQDINSAILRSNIIEGETVIE
jgi:LPS-assembly lipoprotein